MLSMGNSQIVFRSGNGSKTSLFRRNLARKSKSRYGSDSSKIEEPLSQTVRFDWNKNSFVPPAKEKEFVDSLGAYPSLQSVHIGQTGSRAGFVRREFLR